MCLQEGGPYRHKSIPAAAGCVWSAVRQIGPVILKFILVIYQDTESNLPHTTHAIDGPGPDRSRKNGHIFSHSSISHVLSGLFHENDEIISFHGHHKT